MAENRYLRINYTIVGSSLALLLICIYEAFVNGDQVYIKLIDNNYLLLILIIILSLLFGITINIINQDGLKRISFFGGYVIRSVNWNKIKYFMEVDEEWLGTGGVYNEDSIWFIGYDNILRFRIVAKNKNELSQIINEVNNFKEKYDKTIKYTDPIFIIYRLRKIRNESNKK